MNAARLAILGLAVILAAPTWAQGPAGAGARPPAPAGSTAQDPGDSPQRLPRFRGGANLVRVDAYITENGEPVTDLRPDEVEVLENGVPQRIESFDLVRPAPPVPQGQRGEPSTAAESRDMATDAEARLFVLFLDLWHVQIAGSYRAQNPLVDFLDRAIGRDDLVGVMTPEMSARNLTFARRTTSIEGMLRTNWFWGERDQLASSDPREGVLKSCYPDVAPEAQRQTGFETAGVAKELIERRRERRTLDAVEDLIRHLEGVREERKFVVLLSEGWTLYRPNENLARPLRLGGRSPQYPDPQPPIGIDSGGRLTAEHPQLDAQLASCERERAMLAFTDNEVRFNELLQRANRANVSFYPVDPRGVVAFDDPIGPMRPAGPLADHRRLTARQDALRTLAAGTDGTAVLNTNDIEAQLARVLQDTGAYYLFGYYSTNTRLDGRFRRLTVRVTRPGVEVRARPGYLAPTEAELASARVDALMNGAEPGHSTGPPGLAVALDRLAPARASVPLRALAAGGPGYVWLTVELDAATMTQMEWQQGATARVSVEHERGEAAPLVSEIALDPGQRTLSVMRPEREILPPGRYVIRLQVVPAGGRLPLQTTVDAIVPAEGALLGTSGVTLRRGPTTGVHYAPTADPRFRRTERLRLEIPRAGDARISARLLNRRGQEMPLVVSLAEKLDQSLQFRFVVADLTLAPLAQGEYAIEVTAERGDTRETVTYGFRIVP